MAHYIYPWQRIQRRAALGLSFGRKSPEELGRTHARIEVATVPEAIDGLRLHAAATVGVVVTI
jgi:hypothetical protein